METPKIKQPADVRLCALISCLLDFLDSMDSVEDKRINDILTSKWEDNGIGYMIRDSQVAKYENGKHCISLMREEILGGLKTIGFKAEKENSKFYSVKENEDNE